VLDPTSLTGEFIARRPVRSITSCVRFSCDVIRRIRRGSMLAGAAKETKQPTGRPARRDDEAGGFQSIEKRTEVVHRCDLFSPP
jgi:hypothetical protein